MGGPVPCCSPSPAWTPGSYEITNFARWVSNFTPTAGGKPLAWDKLDYDTWRIQPAGAKEITVTFDYLADTLDNAMAWAKPDFAFFNGTNLFLYPEGRGFDFPATVRIHTQSGWQVVTGMAAGPEAGTYRDTNYHDLVDRPFLVGRFELDSTAGGRPLDPSRDLSEQRPDRAGARRCSGTRSGRRFPRWRRCTRKRRGATTRSSRS